MVWAHEHLSAIGHRMRRNVQSRAFVGADVALCACCALVAQMVLHGDDVLRVLYVVLGSSWERLSQTFERHQLRLALNLIKRDDLQVMTGEPIVHVKVSLLKMSMRVLQHK